MVSQALTRLCARQTQPTGTGCQERGHGRKLAPQMLDRLPQLHVLGRWCRSFGRWSPLMTTLPAEAAHFFGSLQRRSLAALLGVAVQDVGAYSEYPKSNA